MGDFLFEWSDTIMGIDGVGSSMPIQQKGYGGRSMQSMHTDHLADLSALNRLTDPGLFQTQVLGNSLGSQADYSHSGMDDSFGTLSPLPNTDSPTMWPSQSMDLDMDIKLEPLDDLLGGSGGDIGSSCFGINDDDCLLDDVNFDDLIIPQRTHFNSQQYDTNPGSPSMFPVHPDEVMGMKMNQSSSLSFPTSAPKPIKMENSALHSLLSGFTCPTESGVWRDPLLGSSPSGSSLPGSSQTHHVSATSHNWSGASVFISRPQATTGTTTSALQELLLRSPSSASTPKSLTPVSPHSVSSPQNVASPLSFDSTLGQSVPRPTSLSAANPLLCARLSSSAPNHYSIEHSAWQRREPRQHLLSTGSLAEEFGGSASSLSTGGGVLSPGGHDLSIDEGIDSDDDSEVEHYDSDSDNESTLSEEAGGLSNSMSKKERYFWQYNVQAKGPKGQRVAVTEQQVDPHSLSQPMDPVFSAQCSSVVQGIKHSGKARRGDGNDLTPNPRKLVSIGRELDKLNRVINEMAPVSELPFNVRPKSRKEKNKLASRACRLKKKAQHEANKIKLYGLEQEHKGMLNMLTDVRSVIIQKLQMGGASGRCSSPIYVGVGRGVTEMNGQQQNLMAQNVEKISRLKCKHRIAGHTTDFVNRVIENCQSGNTIGCIEEVLQTLSNARLGTSPATGGGDGFSPH